MALLAEQKRKVKFGLDPRNVAWSNDESKVGQKLMEKMGWTKGKGLGANEDGMTDHIKASYKSDSRGLGCTLKEADAWVAHQDDFNDLLKTLNSENTEEVDTKTDLKTTESKRFYGRFARGRVSTLRSTEDLDCIFGKRKSSKSNSVEKESQVNEQSVIANDNTENSHGLMTTTSTYSVQEYFAKKMAERKLAAEKPQESDFKAEVERPQFGGPQFGTVRFSYDDNSVVSDVKEFSKKGISSNQSRGWYDEFLANEHLGDVCEEEIIQSKKKKKFADKEEASDSQENKYSCEEGYFKNKRKNKVKSETSGYVEKNIYSEDNSKKNMKRKNVEENEASDPGEKSICSEKQNKNKKKRMKDKGKEGLRIFDKESDSKNKKKSKREKEVNDSVEKMRSEENISKKKKRKNEEEQEENDNIQKSISSEEIYKKRKRKNKMEEGFGKELSQVNKKRKKNKIKNVEQNVVDEHNETTKDIVLKCKKKGKKEKNIAKVDVEQKTKFVTDSDPGEKRIAGKRRKKTKKKKIDKLDIVQIAETAPKKNKNRSKNIKKDRESVAAEKAFSGSNISDVRGYGVVIREPKLKAEKLHQRKPKQRKSNKRGLNKRMNRIKKN